MEAVKRYVLVSLFAVHPELTDFSPGRLSLNPSEHSLFANYVTSHLRAPPNAVPSDLKDDEGNPRVFFGDVPNPRDRYRVLKGNPAYRRCEMAIPPVFEADGTRIHPFHYRAAIPEGTIVAARGTMKM